MKLFRLYQIIFLSVFLCLDLLAQKNSPYSITGRSEFIKGADASVLLAIEENGGVYYENGIPKDALQIFKDHGINYIRLRIWHTPANGYYGLDKTLQMASRIKNLGLRFLLDFHYSDTWADPAHQSKPAVWQNLIFDELKDSVYQYTRNVITTLKNQNTLPDIVQIGNEITCGILWDDGRVCDQFNNQQQWSQLSQLINEGIRGVNESLDADDTVKVMIHIDRGGDNAGSQWFFDNLLSQNVNFDFIGLSYYPWWHGTIDDLEFNLNDLAVRYGKEIIVVETAYPWTLDWFDNTQNIVGETSQLLQGYPATVEGQKNYLIDIMNIILNVPDNLGTGIFYWEPDWISTPSFGSPWENLTLFSFSGEMLNSISAFDSIQTDVKFSNKLPVSYQLYQNYPNPFNPVTSIEYTIPMNPPSFPFTKGGNGDSRGGFVTLKVYNIIGEEITTLVNEIKPPGIYNVTFDASGLSSGVYFYMMIAGDFTEVKKMIISK